MSCRKELLLKAPFLFILTTLSQTSLLPLTLILVARSSWQLFPPVEEANILLGFGMKAAHLKYFVFRISIEKEASEESRTFLQKKIALLYIHFSIHPDCRGGEALD